MAYIAPNTSPPPPPSLGPPSIKLNSCLPCELSPIAVQLMCAVTCLAENLAWRPVVGLGICVRAVHGAHCGAEPEQMAS